MKYCYTPGNFREKSLNLIEEVNDVIDWFNADNYTPTLRALYYQLVTKNIIENNMKSYNSIKGLVTKGRLAGLISWHGIADETRSCITPYIQGDIEYVLDGIDDMYRPDLNEGQENYIEVWVEKNALVNVIKRAANPWRVGYMACKGYLSASAAWNASQRFIDAENEGKRCHLIHLGDHDPSGIDMTRDNDERMQIFEANVEIHRVALNMDQVEEHNLPNNPAKMTDSRVGQYLELYGESSWELDALEPKQIVRLIDDKIRTLVDVDLFNEQLAKRTEDRKDLAYIGNHVRETLEWARNEREFDDEYGDE